MSVLTEAKPKSLSVFWLCSSRTFKRFNFAFSSRVDVKSIFSRLSVNWKKDYIGQCLWKKSGEMKRARMTISHDISGPP